MIDRATIARIVDANPIEQVVGEYVRLTKRGANMVGLCPFHSERTPSFSVNPSRGIYKCFGCGQGGNAINFLMEIEHLSFLEAVRHLARRANIEVQEREETVEERMQRTAHESIMGVLQWAQAYYARQLLHEPEGRQVGLSYLRERGVAPDIITSFGLGYAPASGHALLDAARSAGYELNYLVRAGLVIDQEGRQYDRFRERVLFPIQNESGRTLGFGGRTLRTDKNVAKYINSPEGEVYHKGETLFGLHQARQQMGREDRCYLVEGYLDVLSLHQRGVTNVVASSGTALTAEQVRRIARFTKNVTLLYDGDSAGIKAAERGADLLLAEGISVRIVPLPGGQDPDDFARSVPTAELMAYLEAQVVDFIRFRTERLLQRGGTVDPIARADLAKSILRSVALVVDPILRQMYLQETAEAFGLSEELLATQLSALMAGMHAGQARQRAKLVSPPEGEETATDGHDVFLLAERDLLSLLLNYGERALVAATGQEAALTVARYVVTLCEEDGIEPRSAVGNAVYGAYKEYVLEGGEEPQVLLLRHENPEVVKLCVELTTPLFKLSRLWYDGEDPPALSVDMLLEQTELCVLTFKSQFLERRSQDLLAQLHQLGEGQDASELLEAIKQNNQVRGEFAKVMRRIKL